MPEFIQNPRRSPRAPARCRTTVVSAQGTFEATTEDVGGHGCQLVSPRLVRKGEPIQLQLTHEAMKESLRVAGRVAWASDRAPWRLGIAYDEAALVASQAWFDELLGRADGLSAFRRIPDRIALDAVVYLATPPRFLVDFTPDEVALLRAVGSGSSVAELRSMLRDRWEQVLRALFSLLAHQHVTLARGASVHPDAWRKILSDLEMSLAVESLPRAPAPELPPSPDRAAPAARAARAVTPVPAIPAAPAPAPVPAVADWTATLHRVPATPAALEPAPATETPDWLVSAAEMMPGSWRPAEAAATPAIAPPRVLAGDVPWSTTPPPLTGGFAGTAAPRRSQEAQGCYERALAELEAGRIAGAMALLRRALALAPGDPEITGAMARATERKR